MFISSTSYSQLFEGGIFLGGTNYIGDVGPTTYVFPKKLGFGLVAKFNYSPRITFKGTLRYTNLMIPTGAITRPFNASSKAIVGQTELAEGALGLEFSFFKYSLQQTGFTQTPYINLQFGLAYYSAITEPGSGGFVTKQSFNPVLPFGIGYKMKLAENFGISFETTFTYTFKDNIDRNNFDIDILSFGNPNSDDWYVFTGISIVYAFGRAGCYTGVF